VTVTPALAGYYFDPSNQVIFLQANTNNVNFAGSASLRISGRLTEAGVGVATWTVTAGGVTVSTATDGSYAVAELRPGDYTVIPQAAGVGFSPASVLVTLSNAAATGIDFNANPPQISIARLLSNLVANLTVTGLPARTYKVQINTNSVTATNWLTFTNQVTGSNATFTVPVTNSPSLPFRLFRASTP
jgi:hypothetical protein